MLTIHSRHTSRVAKFVALLALTAIPGLAQDAKTVALPAVIPSEYNGSLRNLPQVSTNLPTGPTARNRNELNGPTPIKTSRNATPTLNIPASQMPAPIRNFAGMSFTDSVIGGTVGAGWPPDINGDVGPNHYIEAVNDAYAIYAKDGTQLVAFTENALFSASGSNLCNGNSFGDPVVLYDRMHDRWILTHFAFGLDGSFNPVSPFFQCFAVSKTADPVAGGWWLYVLRMDPGGAGLPPVGYLNDYGKFGVWNDGCLYASFNEFDELHGEAYAGVAVASLSLTNMEAGLALVGAIGVIGPASNPFTLIPSHISGGPAGRPAAGTPNYLVSESGNTFAFEVRKFTPGVNCGAGGTVGSVVNVTQASYTFDGGDIVPQPGTTNKLDSLVDRLMQKVQYRKVGAAESLWVTHSVQTSASSPIVPQWAQIDVTGGTVATTAVQQQIYVADATTSRWMSSLAVDSQGNMALGYSTSNSSTGFPSIAYSGRLAGDTLNNLSQTERVLVSGLGSQTNTCGGPCARWGDYTAMSVDPVDDCTFWYTNQYYSSPTNGSTGNWQTRIGSFRFPGCGVAQSLTFRKQFGLASIPLNGSTSLLFTIVNPNPGFTFSNISFTDNLPAGLVVATPNAAGTTCGGTVTAVAGSSSITLSGGSIGTSTGCVVGVNVTGTTAGLKNNTTTALSSTEIPVGPTASASLVVVGPPTASESFTPAIVTTGSTVALSITITNPNATASLSGISFTDILPALVIVASPNGLSGSCGGGTITATPATGIVQLAGATLAPGASCTFSVNVLDNAGPGLPPNFLTVNSVEGGTGIPATATLTSLLQPTVAKVFGAPNILLGGTASLTFTLANPNAATALTAVGLTDNLPAGLVVNTTPNVINNCGGTVNAQPGASIVTLSGASLSAVSTCTFSLTVRGATVGVKNNTTANITTAFGNGGTGSATLTVIGPPVLTQSFSPGGIAPNGTSTLTVTIVNPNPTTALTGIGFSETFPAGLVFKAPSGLAANCGGVTAALTGPPAILSLSGGGLLQNASCTVSVNVTSASLGGYTTTSSTVNSVEAGAGPAASATLAVGSFSGLAIAPNGYMYVADTLRNTVKIYDANGVLTKMGFGTLGSGPLQFNSPSGIGLITTGNVVNSIVVADSGNNRVKVYDGNGGLKFTIGGPGSGDGQFQQPAGITIMGTTNPTILVADSGNGRVQGFNANGGFLFKFGSGQLSRPSSVAVASNGYFYVADSGNNRVAVFDATRAPKSPFGTAGAGPGQFSNPSGVAIDSSGNFLVTDTGNNRVEVFNSGSTYRYPIGSFGSTNGKFSGPSGITIAGGLTYVFDAFNNRIEVFDVNGIFQYKVLLVTAI